ncbi:hypothetical protein NPIL_23481 [Nephila pilipes]|uniref:Uncharacterized protein n=1 Tax=Nephila pilipes TaxID=299642 RepID=A0A8X6U7G4_NEPPI|nr:hypothetical protein NPIL_23481 [Nephila pilipes]
MKFAAKKSLSDDYSCICRISTNKVCGTTKTIQHDRGLPAEMISSANSSRASTPTPREDLHSSCILRKQIETELKTYTDSIDHCQTLIRNLERQGLFDHPI